MRRGIPGPSGCATRTAQPPAPTIGTGRECFSTGLTTGTDDRDTNQRPLLPAFPLHDGHAPRALDGRVAVGLAARTAATAKLDKAHTRLRTLQPRGGLLNVSLRRGSLPRAPLLGQLGRQERRQHIAATRIRGAG